MKRTSSSLRNELEEGGQRSQQLAVALAQISDPEFLELCVHMKAALDAFGGQVTIQALRNKYSVTGERLTDLTKDGNYATDGYGAHYDHWAGGSSQKEPNTDAKDVEAEGQDKIEAITEAVKARYNAEEEPVAVEAA
jgi:hypothetical protein